MKIADMAFFEFVWSCIGTVFVITGIVFLFTCAYKASFTVGNVDYCYRTKYGPSYTLTMHRNWSANKYFASEKLDEALKVAETSQLN
jgi:hypothetical protein